MGVEEDLAGEWWGAVLRRLLHMNEVGRLGARWRVGVVLCLHSEGVALATRTSEACSLVRWKARLCWAAYDTPSRSTMGSKA